MNTEFNEAKLAAASRAIEVFTKEHDKGVTEDYKFSKEESQALGTYRFVVVTVSNVIQFSFDLFDELLRRERCQIEEGESLDLSKERMDSLLSVVRANHIKSVGTILNIDVEKYIGLEYEVVDEGDVYRLGFCVTGKAIAVDDADGKEVAYLLRHSYSEALERQERRKHVSSMVAMLREQLQSSLDLEGEEGDDVDDTTADKTVH